LAIYVHGKIRHVFCINKTVRTGFLAALAERIETSFLLLPDRGFEPAFASGTAGYKGSNQGAFVMEDIASITLLSRSRAQNLMNYRHPFASSAYHIDRFYLKHG
jgi:hypothetical protein